MNRETLLAVLTKQLGQTKPKELRMKPKTIKILIGLYSIGTKIFFRGIPVYEDSTLTTDWKFISND